MVATGTTAADVVGSFMALLSFVDSAPRAYRLKVGNACPPISTSNGTSPGNPYLGQPEQINTAQYLAGGRVFTTPAGTFTSANITPDYNDRPAGLTLAGFLEVMHYGHDPRDPPGDLLQVMSWPLYRWKTDQELNAIYEYLKAIPSLPDNPNPGP